MGVWDSVLNTVNRITGDAATVSMTFSPGAAMPGDELVVQVEVQNGNAPLDVRALVLDIEANEHIALRTVERALDEFSDAISKRQTSAAHPRPLSFEPHDVNVFRAQVRVAGAYTLGVGEKKSYTGRVRVPAQAQPTYVGTNVSHRWQMRARLDILGTDPSNRWMEFVVGRRV